MPGGFGSRGIEGKIQAAHYARTNQVPYLGLCLGMQLLVVEFARCVLDNEEANSTEFDRSTRYPVIDLMPDQQRDRRYGRDHAPGPVSLRAYSRAPRRATLTRRNWCKNATAIALSSTTSIANRFDEQACVIQASLRMAGWWKLPSWPTIPLC